MVPQGGIIWQLMRYNFASNALMRSNDNNGKDRKILFLQIVNPDIVESLE